MAKTDYDLADLDSADFDGPDPDAVHVFAPKHLDSGDPTLVCRRCTGWFDEPQHAATR